VDIGEKVLERLATSDKTTIVIEKQPDGKMRLTSGSWDGEKVFLKGQVLKVWHANADARLRFDQKVVTSSRPRLLFFITRRVGADRDDRDR
jgi:hypothetical protein